MSPLPAYALSCPACRPLRLLTLTVQHTGLLRHNTTLRPAETRCLLPQVSSTAGHGRALSPERIRQIAVGSLRALDHLHRRGVCVRDIKPENLLLRGPGGAVVLADLGLATRSDSGGRLSSQVWQGPPEYLVPEARTAHHWTGQDPQHPGYQGDLWAVKRPVLTSKVDVYALGLSLFRCAAWRGDVRGWQTAMPADLRAFLDHLMEANPAKRPTPRRALQHPILTTA